MRVGCFVAVAVLPHKLQPGCTVGQRPPQRHATSAAGLDRPTCQLHQRSCATQLPPAAPIPRIRFILKTNVKRVRCTIKRFAPQEFSGLLGSGRRPIHPTHSLAGGRGVVWCWKCGTHATIKPKTLAQPCRKVPTQFGRATLARIKKGKPPYGLGPDGPGADDTCLSDWLVGVRLGMCHTPRPRHSRTGGQ